MYAIMKLEAPMYDDFGFGANFKRHIKSVVQIGLFQKKKTGGGGLRTYLLEKPLEFFVFSLCPWKFPSNPEIRQNCVTSLGNSEAKNQDPWKFRMIFFWSHLEIPFFN